MKWEGGTHLHQYDGAASSVSATPAFMFKGDGATCCSLLWEQGVDGIGEGSSRMTLSCVIRHLMHPSLALIYSSARWKWVPTNSEWARGRL